MTMTSALVPINKFNGGAGTMDGSSAANAGVSALQIKRQYPSSASGIYWIKPPSGSAVQIYCDMVMDGGGWMLVAHTVPGATLATAGTWGWKGPAIGSLSTFSNCYQLGIYALWQQGLNFTQFCFGNQATNNDYSWGPYVYTVAFSSAGVADFFSNDSYYSIGIEAVLQQNTNIYGGGSIYPGMQQLYGYATTGTADDVYYLRDVPGPSAGGYGINASGLLTTYCNVSSPSWYSGPFCNGATLNGNNYVQGGSSTSANMGGTTQVMLMVR